MTTHYSLLRRRTRAQIDLKRARLQGKDTSAIKTYLRRLERDIADAREREAGEARQRARKVAQDKMASRRERRHGGPFGRPPSAYPDSIR